MVSQTNTGSSQSVPGTFTTAGEMIKLVINKRPPRIAAGGTLIDFATCEHPCIIIKCLNYVIV